MNIAIISLGSGGTMGHMSLTTKLSASMIEKNNVYLFSDHNYSGFSNIKNPKFKTIKIPSQEHQQTVGGELTYKFKEAIFLELKKNKIDTLIFSTFFDMAILKYCKENKIKTILVSYPLRDSHRQAIKIRKYDYLFDNIFTLKDVMKMNKMSSKEEFVSPIKGRENKYKNIKNIKNILITCGGGGRPSSALFFKIIKEVVMRINKEHSDIKFTIIQGNSKEELLLPNSKIIKWSKNFDDLLIKSDLVISEAGYYTMLDLILLQKVAILIPGERRIDNQELRAVNFQMNELGWTVFPSEDPSRLKSLLDDLIENPEKINKKSKSFTKVKDQIYSGKTIDQAILESV